MGFLSLGSEKRNNIKYKPLSESKTKYHSEEGPDNSNIYKMMDIFSKVNNIESDILKIFRESKEICKYSRVDGIEYFNEKMYVSTDALKHDFNRNIYISTKEYIDKITEDITKKIDAQRYMNIVNCDSIHPDKLIYTGKDIIANMYFLFDQGRVLNHSFRKLSTQSIVDNMGGFLRSFNEDGDLGMSVYRNPKTNDMDWDGFPLRTILPSLISSNHANTLLRMNRANYNNRSIAYSIYSENHHIKDQLKCLMYCDQGEYISYDNSFIGLSTYEIEYWTMNRIKECLKDPNVLKIRVTEICSVIFHNMSLMLSFLFNHIEIEKGVSETDITVRIVNKKYDGDTSLLINIDAGKFITNIIDLFMYGTFVLRELCFMIPEILSNINTIVELFDRYVRDCEREAILGNTIIESEESE